MFTTMCPNAQQTSDNLIVEDYCFIIEIIVNRKKSGLFLFTMLKYIINLALVVSLGDV